MAPEKLASVKNGEQQNRRQTLDKADEEHSDKSDEESDSDSDSEEQEGEGAAMVPPKKPKFREQVGPEPGENGSECSSPSASAFVIMPAVKPSGKKKTPASKIFCDEDEIALLKGLTDFWANGRNNKWTEFHNFVKDDLTNQFSKIQVSEKIRAFKRKFETNSGRARANGGRIDFSDRHQSLVFELSKALWGDEEGIAKETAERVENEDEEANRKPRKRKQVDEHDEEDKIARKRKKADEHDEKTEMLKQEKQVDEHHEEAEIVDEDFQSTYPLLYASFDMFRFPEIAKEKCVLIAREKAQELEDQWRKLNAEACRLELKKIDLIRRDLQDHPQRK